MELYIEHKSGDTETRDFNSEDNELLLLLLEDEDVVSFQVIKGTDSASSFNAQKKCALKKTVSSIRKKDCLDNKKKETEENNISRRYRREKFLEKNISLPGIIGKTLSVCSLLSQKIYWSISETDHNLNREDLCNICNISKRTADIAIKELTDHSLIKREGTKKTGYYKICDTL